jgi:hypothetical protein
MTKREEMEKRWRLGEGRNREREREREKDKQVRTSDRQNKKVFHLP